MYRVNERIQFTDGHFATIRYIGPICQWGESVTAFGIEWDDASRGKNNGNVGDHQYFIPSKLGSGSFIKSDNSKLVTPVTFKAALMRQYGRNDANVIDDIQFGTKIVENYGFEKLNQINANFSKLLSISLDKQGIYRIDADSGFNIDLPRVQTLDLSYNLLTEIDQVETLIQKLPQLRELNLNGNKFNNESFKIHDKHSNVQVLKLSNTGISIININQILVMFPNLRVISIASNNFNDDTIKQLIIPPDGNKLNSIDLSFNELCEIPDINCESVDLSNNRIRSFNSFSVRALDLRYNYILKWDDINKLSLMDIIEDLRINGNPVVHGLSEDEAMINVIGRFYCTPDPSTRNKLYKLNGSAFTEDEITNGELYFINKAKEGKIDNINIERYEELLKKYDFEPSSSKTGVAISDTPEKKEVHNFSYEKINLNIYKIDNTGKAFLICNKLFLKTYSILRLYGTIGKLINKSILSFNVYYFINDDSRLKQYLDDEILTINDFQLSENQHVYIELI